MNQYYRSYKSQIVACIENAISAYLQNRSVLQTGAQLPTALSRIRTFATRGKTFRGVLVCLGHDLVSKSHADDLIPLAAAIECLHSSLLIYDDICDRDLTRRGAPSMHAQYRSESLGMLAGGIVHSIGYNLLGSVTEQTAYPLSLTSYVAQEIMLVFGAEMEDVTLGQQTKNPTKDEILEVYRYKTGRYTCALPLTLGARLTGANEELLTSLANAGEALGMMFQITDDYLGIMEDEKDTGKPTGNDIRENKKTLIRHLLYEASSQEEQHTLNKYFGNENLTQVEVSYIRTLITNKKIGEQIQQVLSQYEQDVHAIIDPLSLQPKAKEVFFAILEYSKTRKK